MNNAYSNQAIQYISSQEIQILILKKGKELGKFKLNQQEIIIGKDSSSDIKLTGFSLSKKHIKLLFQDKNWSVQDLSTMTGTYVNGERIIEHSHLTDKDRITCLDYEIRCLEVEKNTMTPAPAILYTASDTQIKADNTVPEPMVKPAKNVQKFNQLRQELHSEVVQTFDLRRHDISSLPEAELKKMTKEFALEFIGSAKDSYADINIDQLIEAIIHDIIGLGPLETLLQDHDVSEIMVNCADEIFIEKNGTIEKSDFTFANDAAVLSVIDRIITPLGRRIDQASPMVDARLADGSRVNAIIPPLAIKGPCITIRKFPNKRLNIDDLIGFGSMNKEMGDFFKVAVSEGKNILVSGGTGTGKTTLLNVLSNLIPMHERVITIEDAAELKLNQPDLVALESKPANIEGSGAIHIRDLVKNALRMRPNRIVVGECRGAEALDMLQAMNTGHDGSLTTLHANTPRDALSRLEVMVMMAGMDIPIQAIREQICSAVHIIVQQTRFPCGARKITHVTEVVGMEAGIIQLQNIFTFQRQGVSEQGKVKGQFRTCGFIPSFYQELADFGKPQDTSLFTQGHL